MDRITGETTTLTEGGITVASAEVNMHSHWHWHEDGRYHNEAHQSKNQYHHGNPALAMKLAAGAVGSNVDGDGDGYTPFQGDCDDNNFSVNPGAFEIEGNGIDDDCNPSTPDNPDISPEDQVHIDFINDLANSSKNVQDYLLGVADPDGLSDAVLMAVINRDPSLNGGHNANILTDPNNVPLSDNVLIAAINKGTLTTNYEWVLEASKPLSDNVLIAAIDKGTIMDSSSYGYTLRQNHLIIPLTDTVINAAITKGTIMDSAEYIATLTAISPLSEPVLDTLVNSDPIMVSSYYKDLFLNHSPGLPQSILDQLAVSVAIMNDSDRQSVLDANP